MVTEIYVTLRHVRCHSPCSQQVLHPSLCHLAVTCAALPPAAWSGHFSLLVNTLSPGRAYSLPSHTAQSSKSQDDTCPRLQLCTVLSFERKSLFFKDLIKPPYEWKSILRWEFAVEIDVWMNLVDLIESIVSYMAWWSMTLLNWRSKWSWCFIRNYRTWVKLFGGQWLWCTTARHTPTSLLL